MKILYEFEQDINEKLRLLRLEKLGLTDIEIVRAGIKVWEDRKKLPPLWKEIK